MLGAVGTFVGGAFDDDHDRDAPGGWWTFLGVDVALDAHDVVRPDRSGRHDDTSIACIAPFDAIELDRSRLFLPEESDE